MNPETSLLKAILQFVRISLPQPWIRVYKGEGGKLFKIRTNPDTFWIAITVRGKQFVFGVGRYDILMTFFMDLTK